MLLQFTFKNFRSFKDENTLDMRATKVKELIHHVRKIGKEKVLPITAIYGANASGKSNVINALQFMGMCIRTSVIFGTKIKDEILEFPYSDIINFSFVENADNFSSLFEITFMLTNKKKYIYGFVIDKNGFREEWLKQVKANNKHEDIITRKNYEMNVCELKQKGIKENIKTSLKKTSLIVSLGAMLNNKLCMSINEWFDNIFIANFGDNYLDMILSKSIVSSELKSGTIKNLFIKYISSFDTSIVDYYIEEKNNNEDNPSYIIYTYHKMIDSDKKKRIPLALESSGTQKMITLFLHFYHTLKKGGILIVDELNAKLHPLLMRAIINLFADIDTNPNNAQLIFTTHDVWLMDSEILRRDEIWFTEKNSDGVSELYSFVELKGQDGKTLRKDLNFMKNYMLGKFGGVPKLKQFQIEVGENNGQE